MDTDHDNDTGFPTVQKSYKIIVSWISLLYHTTFFHSAPVALVIQK